jgi:hypothetical protein
MYAEFIKHLDAFFIHKIDRSFAFFVLLPLEAEFIFVSCDLIGPQLVGNHIRFLHIKHFSSPAGHHTFEKFYYAPVEKTK